MRVLICSSSRAFGPDAVTTSALMLRTMIMKAGNYGLPLARFVSVKRGSSERCCSSSSKPLSPKRWRFYIAGGGSR